MKTARRQELRTNELAQQLDELADFFRRYGKQFAGGVVVAVAVLIAGYVYVSGRQSDIQKGWADLYDVQTVISAVPTAQTAHYQAIYARNLDPLLSALALIRVGEIALSQSVDPGNPAAERADWARQAREAFERVTNEFGHMPVPLGLARFNLGILAENAGDFAAARDIYTRIVNDPTLAALPAGVQAKYRLEHLEDWTPVVEFPPPLPTPEPTTAPATQPADASAPVTIRRVDDPADAQTTTQPAP